jgi:hypothetical protein
MRYRGRRIDWVIAYMYGLLMCIGADVILHVKVCDYNT